MDVVRITQALRQQQPGRLNPSRGGNNTMSSSVDCPNAASSEPISVRRNTWDNTLNLNTTTSVTATSMEQHNGSSSNSPTSTRTAPASASPSSSFFTLPSSFSLASFLPSAAAEASGLFSGGGGSAANAAAAAATGAGGNMGEIESLLLRSMPMFGNLVSRD